MNEPRIAQLQHFITARRAELNTLLVRHGGLARAKRIGAYPTIQLVAREVRTARRVKSRLGK